MSSLYAMEAPTAGMPESGRRSMSPYAASGLFPDLTDKDQIGYIGQIYLRSLLRSQKIFRLLQIY